MSEPKLISPMLDGFVMGAPLSDHDGVQCCPAMKENSEDKYIVKIISVPASQVQLEALLLAGAYQNPAEAMDYFKELAEGIVKEAEFLKKISKLEGFVSYDAWQIVPMEDNRLGYQVYLLSSYRRSLEKFMRRNPVTHLAAVNLGLDLCAAMAICRRAGRVCVDLKPSNIFISEDKEYRIGDLGFASLRKLKYIGMPSKYISAYTAPELLDPMSTLNATVDIYAAGMILYQIYNNGQLPYEDHASAEVYPTPENADNEMAEIIMKAIAPNPEDRWQDPIAMGQALVAYLQRNTVNDVPIVPPAADITSQGEESAPAAPQPSDEEVPADDETVPGDEDVDEQTPPALSEEADAVLALADELISGETPESGEPEAEESAPEAETEEEPQEEPSDAPSEEEEPQAPESDTDLTAADLPEEPVATEETETTPEEEEPESPRKKRGWLVALIIGLVLAILACGAFVFYKYYYQQTIDSLDVVPFESQVTVKVDTAMDTSLLTVFCTDIYGTTQQLPLTDGQAVFTDLQADTQYKIHLEVDGFHALVGSTSTSFSTAAQTTIPVFTAATGNEDGSVMLSFTVEGPDCEEWTVTYGTEGEDEQVMTFTGHTVTITGLTVGKTYAFTLQPGADLYMVGDSTLEFTASAIVLAEHLTITDYSGGTITVTWNVPEGAEVESWTVRCYSDSGYSEILETTDTTASFQNIDPTKAHNIEVTASGMTQASRATMSANPTNITSVNFEESGADKLVITWDFEGTAPEGGWLLMYSYDESDYQSVIRCSEPKAEVSPRVPGTDYHIVIQSASGTSVFNNTHSYTTADAQKYADHDIQVDYCVFNLCKVPDQENWRGKDVPTNTFKTTFSPGEKIGMVIKSSTHYIPQGERISAFYVIKDETGSVIHELLTVQTGISWYEMWRGQYPYTGIEIPVAPRTPGNYTLELYWNFQFVTSVDFTIAE